MLPLLIKVAWFCLCGTTVGSWYNENALFSVLNAHVFVESQLLSTDTYCCLKK